MGINQNGKSCKHCGDPLVVGKNTKTYIVNRRDYSCYPCVRKRKKKSKGYVASKTTNLVKVHGRNELDKRLVAKFNNVRICAVIRDIPFQIERELFISLTNKTCFYCNAKSTVKAPLGLDRLDSTYGYTALNVVGCCKHCNVAKNNLSVIDFLKHCEKILKNMALKEGGASWAQ